MVSRNPRDESGLRRGKWSTMTNIISVLVRWTLKIDHYFWQMDFIKTFNKSGGKKSLIWVSSMENHRWASELRLAILLQRAVEKWDHGWKQMWVRREFLFEKGYITGCGLKVNHCVSIILMVPFKLSISIFKDKVIYSLYIVLPNNIKP